MKTSITGFFSTPDYYFYLVSKLLNLINGNIDNKILKPYPLRNVKAKELEIMLDTNIEKQEMELKLLAIKTQHKYLSVLFNFPYHQVVINEKVNIEAFVSLFFEALEKFLLSYQDIPHSVYVEIKQDILKQIEGDESYIYKPTEKELAWRSALKGFLKEYRETGQIPKVEMSKEKEKEFKKLVKL